MKNFKLAILTIYEKSFESLKIHYHARISKISMKNSKLVILIIY